MTHPDTPRGPSPVLKGTSVLVVGAGIMGAGIAQVAAQAGHAVRLFDNREGAAAQSLTALGGTFDGLVKKGKLGADAAQATLARITPAARLEDAGHAGLVVEAIVENLEVKRGLLKQLEGIVGAGCVLATNTSSISVTALANGMAHPERLVGMHFFNPVPLMKLVEVVSGLHTDRAVAEAIFELSLAWGKTPVHTRSTPGFIVNRIARPYYAETLALLLEQAATPEALDACLKAAGFRMGPCELMDLIGHDTNFAVTNSVYEANFYDKRYVPSLVQREMVDGGLLGRKSGRGFYRYGSGAAAGAPPLPPTDIEAAAAGNGITVHGDGVVADRLEQAARHALEAQGSTPVRQRASAWTGFEIDGGRLVLTDGRTATELADGCGTADVAVFDRALTASAAKPVTPGGTGAAASAPARGAAATALDGGGAAAPLGALAYAVAERTGDGFQRQAAAWLAAIGYTPVCVADTPGLVVARTAAMLINEAADAVQQGVCSEAGADAAMKLGVNYPGGPFEWLAAWSPTGVVAVLDALDAHYRGERYRVSPWLRRRASAA